MKTSNFKRLYKRSGKGNVQLPDILRCEKPGKDWNQRWGVSAVGKALALTRNNIPTNQPCAKHGSCRETGRDHT